MATLLMYVGLMLPIGSPIGLGKSMAYICVSEGTGFRNDCRYDMLDATDSIV